MPGTETRTSILPTIELGSSGFIPPNYDFTSAVPTPKDIGVSRDNTLDSVINAVRGVAYYSDVIGFGQSGNPLTSGMSFSPLGINYFMDTGLKCTNGKPMSMYVEGIPNGNALGNSVKNAMAEMGLPGLRGLAPGMMEDVESALNPKPILQAAFGSPYPVCVQKTLPVGDAKGQITDPKSGEKWITSPVDTSSGRPMQTAWIQKLTNRGDPVFVSQAEADATAKVEGFSSENKTASLAIAIGLLGLAVFMVNRR